MKTQHRLGEFPINHHEGSRGDLSERHEEYSVQRREEGDKAN